MSAYVLTWIMLLISTILVIGLPVTALLIFLKHASGAGSDPIGQGNDHNDTVDDENQRELDENGNPVVRQRKDAISDADFEDW